MSSRKSSSSRLKGVKLFGNAGHLWLFIGFFFKEMPGTHDAWEVFTSESKNSQLSIASGLVWMKILKNAKWLEHLIRSPTIACSMGSFLERQLALQFQRLYLSLSPSPLFGGMAHLFNAECNYHLQKLLLFIFPSSQSPIPHILFSSTPISLKKKKGLHSLYSPCAAEVTPHVLTSQSQSTSLQ